MMARAGVMAQALLTRADWQPVQVFDKDLESEQTLCAPAKGVITCGRRAALTFPAS